MNIESLSQIAGLLFSFIERNPEYALVCVLCVTACMFRLAKGIRLKVVVHLHYRRRAGKHAKR